MDSPTRFVFDAYGTLFDLASPARKIISSDADCERLTEVWRNRQLEYAWTDMAVGQPPDFWNVTKRALRTAIKTVFVKDDAILEGRLLALYANVGAYADAQSCLQQLRQASKSTFIFSNANQEMLEESTSAAKLPVDEVFSVDGSAYYKPREEAYAHLFKKLDCRPEEVTFVSSNAWDVCGAGMAGCKTIWINRMELEFPFPFISPKTILTALSEIPAKFDSQ